MSDPIILASGSAIRAEMLRRSGVAIDIVPARIDEQALKDAMLAEGATARDIADALAETKALRVSAKHPSRWVLGCDQILEHQDAILSKPRDPTDARAQLARLSGSRHSLLSAAVLCDAGQPIWRHVGQVHLTMRSLSDAFIADYVDRNWESIRDSVGCYKIEEEGVRLFSRIEGDHFTIQGLPLIEFLSFLVLRGRLAT